MNTPFVVQMDDLWVGFRQAGGVGYVLRGASMRIKEGDLVCLLGPSGSGKSVLLNLLIGSLRPGRANVVCRGGLWVMGQEVLPGYPEQLIESLGIVFQENALFEDLPTRENIRFALKNARRDKVGMVTDENIDDLLAGVDLIDPPGRVSELSGGQKKRLALARTLARNPAFLIFDEPTSGLDPQLCRQVARLIEQTHRESPERTTLVVTHDYEAMLPVATRALLLNPATGRIEEISGDQDAGTKLAELPPSRPYTEPENGLWRALHAVERAVVEPLEWIRPLKQVAAHPLPGSWRQMVLRAADTLMHPALYVCAAGAVLGGLGTFFALENNPLKGAMDRQALIGLGKVLLAIVIPLLTSVLFAARVGAGAAARLGNIRLSRQDDALRMLGRDPGSHLVVPLFWACLLGLPLLTLPVAVATSLSSVVCACLARPVTPFGWASAYFLELTPGDIFFDLIKLIGSGGLVAATAAHFGLKRKSSAEDLGRDVTSTIVTATFLVILWHGAWTFAQYGGL